jgi:hypothetical protein
MLNELRKHGLDKGYEPVPTELRPAAERLLAGQQIATMDKRFRYLTRKRKIAAANRRHNEKMREARERLASRG